MSDIEDDEEKIAGPIETWLRRYGQLFAWIAGGTWATLQTIVAIWGFLQEHGVAVLPVIVGVTPSGLVILAVYVRKQWVHFTLLVFGSLGASLCIGCTAYYFSVSNFSRGVAWCIAIVSNLQCIAVFVVFLLSASSESLIRVIEKHSDLLLRHRELNKEQNEVIKGYGEIIQSICQQIGMTEEAE